MKTIALVSCAFWKSD